MSFQSYPSYKDSCVESLGDVPSHWKVHSLGASGRFSASGIDKLTVEGQIETKMVNYRDVFANSAAEIRDTSALMLTTASFEKLSEHTLNDGDFLFTPSSETAADIGHAVLFRGDGDRCVFSYHLVRFEPSKDISPEFGRYALNSLALRQQFTLRARGTTRQILNRGDFRASKFALPPLKEQAAIAAFLDRETAKIDALVEEQRRLIVLLKEKRQAVISHAVTKGLNPDVQMKSSGVEWLGKVPAHWAIKKFPRAVDFQEGPGIMAADFYDDGVPLMRVAGASGRWASLQGCNYLDPVKVAKHWDHFRLEIGDLVISGSASMGTVCEVGPDVAGAIAYTGLIRLRPVKEETTRDFLRSYVHSSSFFTQIELLKAGATIQHFGPNHLRQMLITVPPLVEQGTISAQIDLVNKHHTNLIREAELASALLGERRAALISAAVTGKIDVRASAKVLPFPFDRARTRRLVAAEIVERSAHQATFGRTKLQKLLYLAEAHANINELDGRYLRMPYGPLDQQMIDEIEAGAAAAGFTVDDSGDRRMVRYHPLGAKGRGRAELVEWLGGERMSKLDKIVADFAALDTRAAEAVATLFAVWNDALIVGETLSDAEIVRRVLSEWHPKKAENFRAPELLDRLDWMRRHGLVPTGAGPKTETGRLFP